MRLQVYFAVWYIQDYCQVRLGDMYRWTKRGVVTRWRNVDGSAIQSLRHGDISACGAVLEVRCRYSSLPPDIRAAGVAALVGQRDGDYCPVCDRWPRSTVLAVSPVDGEAAGTYRLCLTCRQVWQDHCDHTPD